MRKLLFIILSIFNFILFFMIINYIFDKCNVREKYYRVVARNKYVYYFLKYTLWILLIVLLMFAYIKGKIYLYIIAIRYFCLFYSLYHDRTMFDWQNVKRIYIDKKGRNTNKEKKEV